MEKVRKIMKPAKIAKPPASTPKTKNYKPKKTKVKTIAANPSQKAGSRGLDNLKND